MHCGSSFATHLERRDVELAVPLADAVAAAHDDDVARLALDRDLGLREMRSVASIEDLYMKIVSGGLEQ